MNMEGMGAPECSVKGPYPGIVLLSSPCSDGPKYVSQKPSSMIVSFISDGSTVMFFCINCSNSKSPRTSRSNTQSKLAVVKTDQKVSCNMSISADLELHDLAALSNLSEPEILEKIAHRYDADQIYVSLILFFRFNFLRIWLTKLSGESFSSCQFLLIL